MFLFGPAREHPVSYLQKLFRLHILTRLLQSLKKGGKGKGKGWAPAQWVPQYNTSYLPSLRVGSSHPSQVWWHRRQDRTMCQVVPQIPLQQIVNLQKKD